MDGCFCVYVVNTTEALLLFFKQRNLEIRNIPISGCTHPQEEEMGATTLLRPPKVPARPSAGSWG